MRWRGGEGQGSKRRTLWGESILQGSKRISRASSIISRQIYTNITKYLERDFKLSLCALFLVPINVYLCHVCSVYALVFYFLSTRQESCVVGYYSNLWSLVGLPFFAIRGACAVLKIQLLLITL